MARLHLLLPSRSWHFNVMGVPCATAKSHASIRLKTCPGLSKDFQGALLGRWGSGQPSLRGSLPNRAQPALLSQVDPLELSSCFKERAIRKNKGPEVWGRVSRLASLFCRGAFRLSGHSSPGAADARGGAGREMDTADSQHTG